VGILDFLLKPIYNPASWVQPPALTGVWWQQPTAQLAQIVVDDVFGSSLDIVDRAAAMSVPAIARARHLIVGSIADLPLRAFRGDVAVPDEQQPTWCYRTDGVSPWHRMAWTVDDLLFYGASLWWRVNGSDEGDGKFPTIAPRVPFELWRVNEHSQIEIRQAPNSDEWTPAPASSVIYIPGPTAGLLTDAVTTIRGGRQIESAWTARTRSPIPPTLFVQKELGDVDQAEVDALIATWTAARRDPNNGGTAFVPFGLEPTFPTTNDDSQMFIQGRNAVRLDVANHTNIPASLLDGSTATASLTYTTAEGQKSSFHEQTLRFWTSPIEHRLSMDDIVPRGQRIRFDITYLDHVAPAGEKAQD
jgi:hypothetical protein